jgi:hypothetical protein
MSYGIPKASRMVAEKAGIRLAILDGATWPINESE